MELFASLLGCRRQCPGWKTSQSPLLAVSIPLLLMSSAIRKWGWAITRMSNLSLFSDSKLYSFQEHSKERYICQYINLVIFLVLYLTGILSAIQPVVVSRVDPDSRKKTICEITRRATSGEQWPQVQLSMTCAKRRTVNCVGRSSPWLAETKIGSKEP